MDFGDFPFFGTARDKKRTVCGRGTGLLLGRLDRLSIGVFIDPPCGGYFRFRGVF